MNIWAFLLMLIFYISMGVAVEPVNSHPLTAFLFFTFGVFCTWVIICWWIKMTNEEILANAPEDGVATHILVDHEYHITYAKRYPDSGNWFWFHPDSGWMEFDRMPTAQNIQSLSDIRRIVELEKRLAEVERERDKYAAGKISEFLENTPTCYLDDDMYIDGRAILVLDIEDFIKELEGKS
jgi:hypothetical protein